MLKKFISLLLLLITLFLSVSGCTSVKKEKVTVLCTVFPIYDWVRNVVGDSENIEVKLLVSGGADLHSYQPSVDDVIDIRSADLVVRVGGNDDSFVGELLSEGKGKDLRLMENEQIKLCHISKSSHGHNHEHEEDHGHEHTTDEHIWLSLGNAEISVNAICTALSELDAKSADKFKANADGYIEKIRKLDEKYKSAVSECKEPKLIFADRFPFVYLTEDYGIEYEAAFEGCSTEADASFETVLRMAKRLDEWSLPYVCVTESSDRKLADAIIRASSKKTVKILVLDSMQSVTEKDIESGITYIGIAEKNLATLTSALS